MDKKLAKYFEKYLAVIIAAVVLLSILFFGMEFYKVVTLMLEFVVLIEVVRMILDFIEKKTLQIRFVMDIFIIFLTRDVVINVTQPVINQSKVIFLIFVIFVFFLFRILSMYFSPTNTPKNINKNNPLE
jgi:uncharacterized membrane protein (DUF373 family)